MRHPAVRTALLLALLLLGAPLALQAQVDEQLVRSYLWPQTPGEFGPAEAGLRAAPWTTGASREVLQALEQIMRVGPPVAFDIMQIVGDRLNQFVVSTPGGRSVPVLFGFLAATSAIANTR